ncbi:MAG: hypothetical protein ACO1RX_22020 [Candidatus Sericytochromatia bacterium]
MKCLSCQHNNLYRERSNGKCSRCKAAFAFEPKRGDLFSDPLFKKVLDQVSDQQRVAFTSRQLYYALARKKHPQQPVTSAAKLLLNSLRLAGFALPVVAFAQQAPEWLIVVSLIYAVVIQHLLLLGLAWWLPKSPVMGVFLPKDTLKTYLDKWRKAHGPIPQLVSAPAPLQLEPARLQELAQYGVDKVVVCDRQDTVDFLIANRFHMEQKCLVLQAGGYPFQQAEGVFEQLKRQPHLQVYVLHDASRTGCELAAHLRAQAAWVPASAQIIDLGLSPHHAQKFKAYWRPADKVSGAAAGLFASLPPADAEWLAQFELELAVIPPLQLLNRLGRMLRLGAEALSDPDADGGWEADSDGIFLWSDLGGADDADGDGDFG